MPGTAVPTGHTNQAQDRLNRPQPNGRSSHPEEVACAPAVASSGVVTVGSTPPALPAPHQGVRAAQRQRLSQPFLRSTAQPVYGGARAARPSRTRHPTQKSMRVCPIHCMAICMHSHIHPPHTSTPRAQAQLPCNRGRCGPRCPPQHHLSCTHPSQPHGGGAAGEHAAAVGARHHIRGRRC